MPSHPSNTKSRLIRLTYPFFIKYLNCFLLRALSHCVKVAVTTYYKGQISDFRFHFISFIIQAKEIIVSCFKLYLYDGCRNVLNNMIDDGGFYLGSVNTFSDEWGEGNVSYSDLMKSFSEISQDMKA